MLRGLARTPLFTITAILSLALGIGSNTAIFSLLDQMLLRTLPVLNPQELVFLYHPGPLQGSVSTDEAGDPSFSYPMFRELQKRQSPFSGLAGASGASASLAYKNQPLPGTARLVSGNYFEVMGVRPALGRLFTAEDDRTPGGHPLVVLSHSYWSNRFGSDLSLLNQPMVINGYTMTVIGVAGKGFFGERFGSTPDVFIPISMKKEMTPDWNGLEDRKNYWVTLSGRLKPGVTMTQADAAINALYRAELEEDVKLLNRPGESFLKRFKAKKIVLKPGIYGRGGLREEGRRPLFLLLGMTILVLLICCANVANLQLARGANRTREIAIRLAIGASRAQIVRGLLAESCLLALGGGLVGLAFAYATLRGILTSLPGWTGSGGFLIATLDLRLLVYSIAVSIGTGLLFGIFPALQVSRPDLSGALKDQAGQSTATGSASLFRKFLVTAQIAVSLLLLISAGLFARNLLNLNRIDLGIRQDHLLTFSLNPRLNQYSNQRTTQFYEQLLARLSAIPGVALVSAARVPAIAGSNSSMNITVEGFVPQDDSGADSNFNSVGPGYFRVMGIPLIAGREFTAADNASAPKVAIVNEAFAKHFLKGRNPVGSRMAQGGSENAKLDIEIAGVVKDSHYSDMRKDPPRVFHTPYLQARRQGSMYFYLRTALDPERIIPLVRREVLSLDPNLPIRDFKTMEAQIQENLFAESLLARLTAIFAGLATLLAAIGLYGVLAFNVARRTREIGIRMALGAGAGHVRSLVAREVAVMFLIGSAIGVAGAAAAGRFVQSILFGMEPWDPATYVLAALALGIVACAAAYLPTRRATNIDPNVALRQE